MFDAIVIGGGIVGAALAYHLVRGGAKTLLFDREDEGRATTAGAGILAPELSGNRSEAWFALAVAANAYYPPLIEQLQAEGGGETGYARCGSLMVAVAAEELADFNRTAQLIFERQKQRGRPAPEALHSISAAEAGERFPPLAPIQRALYYHDAARVDGQLLAGALRRAAEKQYGLVVKKAGVARLLLDGYLVDGVLAESEAYKAGAVVIAGGAWSNAFAAQLLLHIPVEPQRGQIAHLHLPGVETEAWPIIDSRDGYYLVCWPGGRVVVGATRETGSGFEPRQTVAGVRRLLNEVMWVAPGLALAEIKEFRVGLRPLTPDRLPVLGHVPGVDNLYLATGHGATGLQLGPYSGKLIADLMLGRPVETDLSAFDVRRFG